MEKKTKRQKFITLAEKRVNNAIHIMKLIGNLSNHRNYDYTDEHARQIINVLEDQVKELKKRFFSNESDKSKRFEFK